MGGVSKFAEVLPEGYGYVLFVAIDSIFVNMWMARNVGVARKKYDVKYPTMYSVENNTFNCIQRAHQQTLELHPSFLLLLLVGGLQHPKLATGAGAVYLLGRIVFAKGYYTGDPKNRSKGAFGMLGLLTLLGSSLCFAAHQLKLQLPSWLEGHH
jgi:glutathione S-transferase